MASSHLITKASTLLLRSNLSNFRKCHNSRSFHGIMPTEADYLFYAGNDIDQKSVRHPFQISGPGGRCLMKKIKKGLLLWLDMPGVGKSDVKVWVDNNTVFYKGKAPRVNDYEDGRVYGGDFRLVMGLGKMEDVTAEVKNGVVRIFMPYGSSDEA